MELEEEVNSDLNITNGGTGLTAKFYPIIEDLRFELDDWDILDSWIRAKSKDELCLNRNTYGDNYSHRFNLVKNNPNYSQYALVPASSEKDLDQFIENVKSYLIIWSYLE